MSLRFRRVGLARRGLVGVVVAVSTLVLSTLQTPAVAAPSERSLPHHDLPSISPTSFEGDVRDLPNLRPGRNDRPELSAPSPHATSPAGPAPSSPAVIASIPAPTQSFEGLDHAAWGSGYPPDPVGDVGPSNYVEAVNTSVGIYSKTGTREAAFTFNALWFAAGTSTPCDTANRGDPIVVYDPLADQWFVADFAWANLKDGPYYECVAVSKTGDPVTGGWWLYAIRADDAGHPWLNDYTKLAVWPDGLYMTANMYDCRNASCSSSTYKGVRVWAFNQTVMEAGAALHAVVVDAGATYYSMLPSNLRGTPPPVGTPNYLVSQSRTASAFQVFRFHVDWGNTALSSFTGPTLVSHAGYAVTTKGVPQPGTSMRLDPIEDGVMMQAQYRNISGSESLWVSHSVEVVPIGVQWGQIDVTGGVISTTPVQQQIWRNVGGDGVSRWMPSLAVDRVGNMAVGYSASSGSVFPSIRYAGRLVTDPLNSLAQGETTLFAGTGSQTITDRWGDYTAMSVDPVDDCTFWYVNEYYETTGSHWRTRIGSFRFPSCTRTLTVTKSGPGGGTVTSSPTGIDCGSTCSAAFSSGQIVDLTAVPDDGSVFAGWTGACTGTDPCQVTMDADQDVQATFDVAQRTLTVTKSGPGGGTVTSSPTGIDCGSTCSAAFSSGQIVDLTAAPDAGSVFAGWTGACTGTDPCQVTMDTDQSVEATFEVAQHTLTLTKSGPGGGTVTSNPTGIDCGSTCSAAFSSGQIVDLTVVPDAGSVFAGWTGACTGTDPCQVTMDTDQSVEATFEVAQHTLTLTKSGPGGGTVTSSPTGIDCGSTCSAAFSSGQIVDLTAVPDDGSVFAGWTGACTGTDPCQVTMDTDQSVEATFEVAQHTLTLTKSGPGGGTVTSNPTGIDCGSTCSAAFSSGQIVDLTVVPDAGSVFAGWTGACTGTDPCQVTMDTDQDVQATFTLASGCTIQGTAGNDTLIGTAGDDVICGLGGNDVLKGLGGADTLQGGDGNDTLLPGAGDDPSVDGGAGTDTVSYSDLAAAVTVDLSVPSTSGAAGADTLVSIENAKGTTAGDTLIGNTGANALYGLGGADTLQGGDGNDTLLPGAGDDPSVDGGAGTDTVSYSDLAAAVTVDLSVPSTSGAAGADTLVSIENAKGTNAGDTLIGNTGANALYGLGGADTLQGGDGNDTLLPGAGDDPSVDGGAGTDTVSYSDLAAAVTVDLSVPSTSGAAGADTLVSIERVTGTAYDDNLAGDGLANVISGLAGDDVLHGGEGADTLNGGSNTAVGDTCIDPQAGTFVGCETTGTLRPARSDLPVGASWPARA